MRPIIGLKGQIVLVSLLKTERMLGRLEHKEGTRMLCANVDCFDCVQDGL